MSRCFVYVSLNWFHRCRNSLRSCKLSKHLFLCILFPPFSWFFRLFSFFVRYEFFGNMNFATVRMAFCSLVFLFSTIESCISYGLCVCVCRCFVYFFILPSFRFKIVVFIPSSVCSFVDRYNFQIFYRRGNYAFL